jgi:putative nucleotidyltransferase with HDIG domain
MKKPLRALIVEDSEDDAILMAEELRRAGYEVSFERVETAEEMSGAIGKGGWDLILSDYVMPRFSGLAALKLLKQKDLDIPFIMVSGKIGEDTAVEAIKAGACDYVMKDRMMKFAPSVEKALAEHETMMERDRAQEALKTELELSNALLKTAEITSASLDWDETADKVLHVLKGIIHFEGAAVMLAEADGMLAPRKAVGCDDGTQSILMGMRPRMADVRALEKVMLTRKLLKVGEEELPGLIPDYIAANLKLKELIIAPIMAREHVAGFLGVNFKKISGDPRVPALIKGIADQLGAAFENASLYEETQKKKLELAKGMEALSVLHEIDRTILSTLDRDEMLSRVSLQIKRLIPADAGCLLLLDAEGQTLEINCGWGADFKKDERFMMEDFPGADTFFSGRPVMRADILDEAGGGGKDTIFRGTVIRSEIIVPIMSKGIRRGLVRLGSQRVAGFTFEDTAMAEKLAYQIGIALENARLIADLEEVLVNTVQALSSAIDAKSHWTRGHSTRVTGYAVRAGKEMGLTAGQLERLKLAGLLHDIGKIGIIDALLNKPGALTDEEYESIKQHAERGAEILAPIRQFKDIAACVRHHHERWDGKGYPIHLQGEQIPFMARIIAVADSFDSITADRPYREASDRNFAFRELEKCSGTQFEPKVVDAFIRALTKPD